MNLRWDDYTSLWLHALRDLDGPQIVATVDAGVTPLWYMARVGEYGDPNYKTLMFKDVNDAKAWCEIVVQLQGETT